MKYMEAETGGERSGNMVLGYALLEVSDAVIYELTPDAIPYAGFDNFEAVLHTWAPTFLFRNKPMLVDGNIIMWGYANRIDRVGREITLFVDSYRRFGWFGIPVFVAFYFWIYGLICGKCYQCYLNKNALFGVLLILFLFSYFQNNPFESVLQTWWGFFYEVPKHLIALYLGYWILSKILKVRIRGGVIAYGGRT
jgi:hypothetical protein